MKNPFVSKAIEQMIDISGADLLEDMGVLDAFASSDLESLSGMAGLIHNLTGCFNLSVRPMATETELVEEGMRLVDDNRLLAGMLLMRLH